MVARCLQHIGTVAHTFGNSQLVVLAMVGIDNDLSAVFILIVHHVKHKVVVDHAADDDFAVRVGNFPFLGIVVSPLPEMDEVHVARFAVFQGQHIIRFVGELDDIYAVGNVVGIRLWIGHVGNFLEDPLLRFAFVRLVQLDFPVVYCIAVMQVEAVACVGCTHQHVGAIALFLGDPKLIISTMITVDLDLSFVSDFIAPNVKHKVVVDYATDDDFPVFVGYLPFLGVVVSPLPELDNVIVVRLAILEGKDVVGVLGKLDDIFAFGNQLGKSCGNKSQYSR